MQAHIAAQDDDMWFVITDGPMKIMKDNTAMAITAGAAQWIEKTRFEYTTEDKKKENLYNVAKLATGYLLYDVASLLASGCKLPADSCDCSLKQSAKSDDVTDDVINTNPSADSPARLRFILCASLHLLIPIANAKRCRSNLFTRHRFAIANFKYQLLVEALC
ncbi:hypothetical protein F511_15768 [Dorcoceras hygrometricum]|nr:hypothetical protein F511_15768 [Dorcoceras hygrometricum]